MRLRKPSSPPHTCPYYLKQINNQNQKSLITDACYYWPHCKHLAKRWSLYFAHMSNCNHPPWRECEKNQSAIIFCMRLFSHFETDGLILNSAKCSLWSAPYFISGWAAGAANEGTVSMFYSSDSWVFLLLCLSASVVVEMKQSSSSIAIMP